MADHSEEEQVEALKNWWHENGRFVITGIVLGLGVFAGWQGWNWYGDTRTEQAAALYEPILQAEPADRDTIEPIAQELRDSYGRTGYAALSGLAAARAAAEAGDLDTAADWLAWVMEDAAKAGLRHVARARLARVLAENGNTERALELLANDVPESFAGLYAETAGDLHLRAGDPTAAAEAYERALAASTGISDTNLVEMKRNRALGEAGVATQ